MLGYLAFQVVSIPEPPKGFSEFEGLCTVRHFVACSLCDTLSIPCKLIDFGGAAQGEPLPEDVKSS